MACAAPLPRPEAVSPIHTAIAIIMRFSVNDRKPSGTLLEPPTQAHFNSRRSRYTALNTDTTPTVPMNNATGTEIQGSTPATISTPATPSAKG
jgi:hypothetical protein